MKKSLSVKIDASLYWSSYLLALPIDTPGQDAFPADLAAKGVHVPSCARRAEGSNGNAARWVRA